MAPIEGKASIFGRGGGQKTLHLLGYYAPEAGHNPAPSWHASLTVLRQHGVALALIDQSWMPRPWDIKEKFDLITAESLTFAGSGNAKASRSLQSRGIRFRLAKLSLAPFVAWLKDTGVPSLILGMDGAEPPAAATAVESCGRITGFVHERNGLTRPFEVPGFCLIRLLQHVPSSRGQYTPARRRGCQKECGSTPEWSCHRTSEFVPNPLDCEQIQRFRLDLPSPCNGCLTTSSGAMRAKTPRSRRTEVSN
jgi:hypothetical protein